MPNARQGEVERRQADRDDKAVACEGNAAGDGEPGQAAGHDDRVDLRHPSVGAVEAKKQRRELVGERPGDGGRLPARIEQKFEHEERRGEDREIDDRGEPADIPSQQAGDDKQSRDIAEQPERKEMRGVEQGLDDEGKGEFSRPRRAPKSDPARERPQA